MLACPFTTGWESINVCEVPIAITILNNMEAPLSTNQWIYKIISCEEDALI